MIPRYVPGCSTPLELARREAADVHLVDHGFGQLAAQVPVPLPIEAVVDDHAFGRADNAVVGSQKLAGQRAGIRIDQPGRAIEAVAALGVERSVSLKMIQLPGGQAGHEDAPDITPAVGVAIEDDDFRRLAVGNVIV